MHYALCSDSFLCACDWFQDFILNAGISFTIQSNLLFQIPTFYMHTFYIGLLTYCLLWAPYLGKLYFQLYFQIWPCYALFGIRTSYTNFKVHSSTIICEYEFCANFYHAVLSRPQLLPYFHRYLVLSLALFGPQFFFTILRYEWSLLTVVIVLSSGSVLPFQLPLMESPDSWYFSVYRKNISISYKSVANE